MKESRYLPEFEMGRHGNGLLVHDPFPNLLYHRGWFRELPSVARTRHFSLTSKTRYIEDDINAKAKAAYASGFVERSQPGLSPSDPRFGSSKAQAVPEFRSGVLVDRSG